MKDYRNENGPSPELRAMEEWEGTEETYRWNMRRASAIHGTPDDSYPFTSGWNAAEKEFARRLDEAQPFKEAVIDALIVGCIYAAEHETNARKAVADLIAWETKIALDPAVSSDAQALINRGAEEAQQKIVVQQERADAFLILAHELGQLSERLNRLCLANRHCINSQARDSL